MTVKWLANSSGVYKRVVRLVSPILHYFVRALSGKNGTQFCRMALICASCYITGKDAARAWTETDSQEIQVRREHLFRGLSCSLLFVQSPPACVERLSCRSSLSW